MVPESHLPQVGQIPAIAGVLEEPGQTVVAVSGDTLRDIRIVGQAWGMVGGRCDLRFSLGRSVCPALSDTPGVAVIGLQWSLWGKWL